MLPDSSDQNAEIEADTFWSFVEAINPSLLDFEHVPRLVEVAGRVVEGDITRLMVLMPPRYFKSTMFSRLLPAYFLHAKQRKVGLASYSSQLAWKLSGDARDYYEIAGGQTAGDTDAKREWATERGGLMWADGVKGSITGSGYDLGVIDDPMKPQHVRSEAFKRQFRTWYKDTWYNRRDSADARMVIVMQRLGPEDPIDFLLRREVGKGEADKAPEGWSVLAYDEIKSDEPLADYDGPKGLPSTCTLIDDPRSTGQILCPSKFPEEEVRKQQAAAGSASVPQRQQREGDQEGDFWKEAWFDRFGSHQDRPRADVPETAHAHGNDWDTAYTADESNSATARIRSARTVEADGAHVWIYGCDWDWVEWPALISWMEGQKPPHFIEAKASGRSAAQSLADNDVPVSKVEVTGGDKYSRASDVQGMVGHPDYGGTGRVHVHASVWEKLLNGDRQGLLKVKKQNLINETGALDLNDTFVQALHRHRDAGGSDGSGMRSAGTRDSVSELNGYQNGTR